MTKSNARAVRTRKNNARIALRHDKVQMERVRAYQERNMDREHTAHPESISAIRKWARQVVARFRNAVRHFFRRRPRGSSISRLSLVTSDAKRFGPFGPGQKRGAAAAWLRECFNADLKMISTRDGRRV